MLLSRALRLSGREAVAFVGGGGKTTAMFRLAEELSAQGPVVTTTTTRIFAAQTRLAPFHLQIGSGEELHTVGALLENHRHVLITGRLDGADEGKAPGLDLETLRLLRALPNPPAILIEADGSRMRPFKAPAEHEPVIPEFVDRVVAVVGVDVLGKPLTDKYVHRPERVAQLAGVPMGEALSPRAVADVLAHSLGGRKGVPPGAAFDVLVNKVDDEGALAKARDLADELMRRGAIRHVIVGAVASVAPVREVHSRVAGIVLAAGASTRMGRLKQILPWQGRAFVAHVAQAALDAGLSRVIVVVGHRGDEVAAALGGMPVEVLFNDAWSAGQSTSVRAGLRAIEADADAAVFFLADQPHLSPSLVRALVQQHRETLAPIVAPRAGERRGNPVLFDRATWPELMALVGDTGGRPLFQKYSAQTGWVEWDASIHLDLDTPEDYHAFVESGQ